MCQRQEPQFGHWNSVSGDHSRERLSGMGPTATRRRRLEAVSAVDSPGAKSLTTTATHRRQLEQAPGNICSIRRVCLPAGHSAVIGCAPSRSKTSHLSRFMSSLHTHNAQVFVTLSISLERGILRVRLSLSQPSCGFTACDTPWAKVSERRRHPKNPRWELTRELPCETSRRAANTSLHSQVPQACVACSRSGRL